VTFFVKILENFKSGFVKILDKKLPRGGLRQQGGDK
jgi:hypothetical protein